MKAYITSREELAEVVEDSIRKVLKEELPYIIRKARQKEWVNTNELMEFTGWSRRTIQYLRDERRIPFSQENRRILYPMEGIEEYLESNRIDPYKR